MPIRSVFSPVIFTLRNTSNLCADIRCMDSDPRCECRRKTGISPLVYIKYRGDREGSTPSFVEMKQHSSSMGTQALNTLWGPLCRSSAQQQCLGAKPAYSSPWADRPCTPALLPWFVAPFRRLGGELGGGVIVPASHAFSWIGGAGIQAFFAGADVPNDTTVLAFKVTFGARLSF